MGRACVCRFSTRISSTHACRNTRLQTLADTRGHVGARRPARMEGGRDDQPRKRGWKIVAEAKWEGEHQIRPRLRSDVNLRTCARADPCSFAGAAPVHERAQTLGVKQRPRVQTEGATPGADAAGVSPVPVQGGRGEPSPGADAAGAHTSPFKSAPVSESSSSRSCTSCQTEWARRAARRAARCLMDPCRPCASSTTRVRAIYTPCRSIRRALIGIYTSGTVAPSRPLESHDTCAAFSCVRAPVRSCVGMRLRVCLAGSSTLACSTATSARRKAFGALRLRAVVITSSSRTFGCTPACRAVSVRLLTRTSQTECAVSRSAGSQRRQGQRKCMQLRDSARSRRARAAACV